MEKLILEMAQKVRDVIKEEPPQIIELKSEIILRGVVGRLHSHKIISDNDFMEMLGEIDKLYKWK